MIVARARTNFSIENIISSSSEEILSNFNEDSDEREDKELQRLSRPLCFSEDAEPEPLFKSGFDYKPDMIFGWKPEGS